jgi:hypothetical protein
MINDTNDLEKECKPYLELPQKGTRERRREKIPHKRFLIESEVKVLRFGVKNYIRSQSLALTYGLPWKALYDVDIHRNGSVDAANGDLAYTAHELLHKGGS